MTDMELKSRIAAYKAQQVYARDMANDYNEMQDKDDETIWDAIAVSFGLLVEKLENILKFKSQPTDEPDGLMQITKDAIGKLAEKHNKADAEFIKNNTMRKFTNEEIKAAKETRDALINEDMPTEMKALYMAGEIVMWDELQKSQPSDEPDAGYWKKRCEAAEMLCALMAAYAATKNVTFDNTDTYEAWQQLKQTPAPEQDEK